MTERLDALATESGRLLVVLEHTRQRVETADGPRDVNPYLSPVVDALRGTALEPIEIDLKARVDDDTWWDRLNAPDGARLLPSSAIWRAGEAEGDAEAAAAEAGSAEPWVAAVRAIRTPVIVHGVDLGPALVGRVSELAARWMPSKIRAVTSIRALLRRLRPAGVLLADEYHRQDWLTAARAEGVPVVAIQHGMIYRGHNGYVHRERPDSLALPDRTYVFGEWERDVLVEASVYRDDEVRVSGSPRLDLAEAAPDADAAALRAELGVRPDDRMVVLSGTYGPAYRRFHIPYALDRLLDRPWPNVHLVVKQHPGEKDRGPYEALVAGLAAARGFAPPPVSVVQHIDLYRLLRSADAHLGIHSTVLTEAVAAGTNNLLADTLASSDLLGYVEAGVAVPVRNGADFSPPWMRPAPSRRRPAAPSWPVISAKAARATVSAASSWSGSRERADAVPHPRARRQQTHPRQEPARPRRDPARGLGRPDRRGCGDARRRRRLFDGGPGDRDRRIDLGDSRPRPSRRPGDRHRDLARGRDPRPRRPRPATGSRSTSSRSSSRHRR